MRTKIVHGIDDNDNFMTYLSKNNKLSSSCSYKLSEDEFSGRWLALKPFCREHEGSPECLTCCPEQCPKSMENFEPCINCMYYGEFVTIIHSDTENFERWEPPVIECVKRCLDCQECQECQ